MQEIESVRNTIYWKLRENLFKKSLFEVVLRKIISWTMQVIFSSNCSRNFIM